jgi:nickel/cobalt transporter (NicO) family protein
MDLVPQLLLVGAVAAVGVLHTLVPDHWMPIALMARQRGWSSRETARAAFVAGTGHVASTLAIAIVVWAAGAVLARRYGTLVDTAASGALVLFGGWIAVSAWRELRAADGPHGPHSDGGGHHHHHHHHHHSHGHGHDHDHGDDGHRPALSAALLSRHMHVHRHEAGPVHAHWHEHSPATAHAAAVGAMGDILLHDHPHPAGGRAALLLILGSSPMIEGIPAFFAAGRYGAGLIGVMAAVFAAATIATYVLLCTVSASGLQRLRLGPVERYGEVLSGVLIAGLGIAFWLWPVL